MLVGFEHGDVQRPYVLGSLWNGHDTPDDLAHTDGSYALHTEAEIQVKADKAIAIEGKDTLKLASSGDMTISTRRLDQAERERRGHDRGPDGHDQGRHSISIEGSTVKVSGMVQLG